MLGQSRIDLVDSSFVSFKQCHDVYSCRGSIVFTASANLP
ncbi:hypothetical protein H206_06344 [Candidatus Electrothrix aarhusensis]|uniref:Uncharacterized protein n=1 Tax=Candidatus Electrothrix aarhusensis TaxID=1859131 RepID=A0A3S3UAN1_9BACT|nr:hypothetical protein H206_06344 [Candidatus Electrothrix aarhusensis]